MFVSKISVLNNIVMSYKLVLGFFFYQYLYSNNHIITKKSVFEIIKMFMKFKVSQ